MCTVFQHYHLSWWLFKYYILPTLLNLKSWHPQKQHRKEHTGANSTGCKYPDLYISSPAVSTQFQSLIRANKQSNVKCLSFKLPKVTKTTAINQLAYTFCNGVRVNTVTLHISRYSKMKAEARGQHIYKLITTLAHHRYFKATSHWENLW